MSKTTNKKSNVFKNNPQQSLNFNFEKLYNQCVEPLPYENEPSCSFSQSDENIKYQKILGKIVMMVIFIRGPRKPM